MEALARLARPLPPAGTTIRSLARDLRPCPAANLLAEKAPERTTVTFSRISGESQTAPNAVSTLPFAFPLDNNALVESCDRTSAPFSSFHTPQRISPRNRPSPSPHQLRFVPPPTHGHHRLRRTDSLLAGTDHRLVHQITLFHSTAGDCLRWRLECTEHSDRPTKTQASDRGGAEGRVDIARGDSYALRRKA